MLLTSPIAAAAQNLLVNGGFEQGPPIPSGSSYTTVGAGSAAIPGWTVTGSTIDYIGPSWTMADGTRGIDLDGAFSTGGIQQTVTTVPGQTYAASFSLAGNSDGAPVVKQVRVTVGPLVYDLTFDTLGKSRVDPGWVRQSYSFVASGTSATIGFASLSPAGNSWGALIDDVRLELQPPGPQPPTALHVESVDGNLVTLHWAGPATGPAPAGYVVKGGLVPGQVLAAVDTGSAAPVFAFLAPPGSYFLRVHTSTGSGESGPSNEVPLHVRVAIPPSAPANLLGLVDGSTVSLAWTNTFAGGEPAGVTLLVSGAVNAAVPLARTDTFSVAGVPPGTYTFAVAATNATGSSPLSTPVTLTFPAGCSGTPQPVTNFAAYAVGNVLSLRWDLPATGAAPSGYLLTVTGAFVGSVPVSARHVSAPVPPGAYTFTVRATNACGDGAATAPQTVVVP
ncbi:MAG: choice-of-anchor C family protein [Vicinamibacterales bacterium]